MRNLIFTLLLIQNLSSPAQNQADTLYLKGGSILVGTISEKNDSLVKFRLNSGSLFFIAQEQVIKNQFQANQKTSVHYQVYLSAGYLIGSSKNQNVAPLSILTEHNLGIGSQFSIGFTTGLEMINESTIPLGGNLKIFFPVSSGAVFLMGASGGYSLSLEKPYDPYNQIIDNKGGSFFNAEVGYIFPTPGSYAFFIALGYRYAEMHYRLNDWWYDEIAEDMYFNRFSFRFGIQF